MFLKPIFVFFDKQNLLHPTFTIPTPGLTLNNRHHNNNILLQIISHGFYFTY